MVKRQPSNSKFTLIFWSILLLLIPLASAEAKIFNAESFTLDNGLQVIIIPKKSAPAVTSMVWYKVGAADEPQGLSGMAHYFEHLMFKGTKKLQPGEFSKIVKKLGGNDNAFTGQDYTAYFESIATSNLERMLEMEADRMVNLMPPQDHFASEKKVVLEERRQRTENDPKGLFIEQMKSALYINHPYGTPVIGWMNEIEGYEWNDVKKFYDTHYAPNNAILIISGNVTAEDIRPMAKKIFGDIKPKDIPSRQRTETPPAIGSSLMKLRHQTINQPSFQNIRLAPSYTQNKEDSLALQIFQEIMSSNATTRLYKNLVVDQKKAVSVNFSYNSNALNESAIWITGTPADDVSLDELENLVMVEIQKVIDEGVTETELNNAIQRMKDAAIFTRDSISGPAMIFGHELTTGSTIDDVENWPENISKVTTAQVQQVATKYLNNAMPWKRASITGHLLPLDNETKEAAEEK
jgi:zinc protease